MTARLFMDEPTLVL